MKKLTITFITLFVSLIVMSQKYQYTTSIVDLQKDKLKVNLKCPAQNSETTVFSFPAIVPGHYAWINFGNMVDDFKAFDKNGNELKINKLDVNSFKIEKAQNLDKIEYFINDTWDDKGKCKHVFNPSGTNFEENTNFIFNNGGVFGFFDNQEMLPIEITVKKPTDFFGYTSLKSHEKDKNTQVFEPQNYHQLIDCPILFTKEKAAEFNVGPCKVSVMVHSENGVSYSEYIARELKPLMNAVEKFLPEMPVNNYTFLFYLQDYTREGGWVRDGKMNPFRLAKTFIKYKKGGDAGALEHGTSSLYYLPDMGDSSFVDIISDVAIHEFMHIVTPLSLHSECIGSFNYTKPEMSQHLWLYEGITEYFSGLIQMQAGLLSPRSYLDKVVRYKIFMSERMPHDFSFTDMSKNVLKSEKFSENFLQVYQKGALMGLLLDMEIMRLTDGEKTLKDVVLHFAKKYGKSKSFSEKDFIHEFVAYVHPDLLTFFDRYVIGAEPLDYKKGFEVVGLNYNKKAKTNTILDPIWHNDIKRKKFSLGGYYTIKRVGENDFAGFQKGDRVFRDDIDAAKTLPNGEYVKEGDEISFVVQRDGKNTIVKFPARYEEKERSHYIQIPDNMSEKQEKMFRLWTNAINRIVEN